MDSMAQHLQAALQYPMGVTYLSLIFPFCVCIFFQPAAAHAASLLHENENNLPLHNQIFQALQICNRGNWQSLRSLQLYPCVLLTLNINYEALVYPAIFFPESFCTLLHEACDQDFLKILMPVAKYIPDHLPQRSFYLK